MVEEGRSLHALGPSHVGIKGACPSAAALQWYLDEWTLRAACLQAVLGVVFPRIAVSSYSYQMKIYSISSTPAEVDSSQKNGTCSVCRF